MGWFKPFKKPNGFKYTPRFYDPVKEAREQRRRELRGESVETDNCEYRPGQYLRTQQQARMERRTLEESRQKSGSSLIIFAVLHIDDGVSGGAGFDEFRHLRHLLESVDKS